jgi:formyl-CoA transferase/CoA:oxalate CoA-transferase
MVESPPLQGVRVLDLTRAMAGPFCTQLLGDMGAEVFKVEAPGGGDETRRWGPFWNGVSCYFLSINRNKKSIVIDLKSKMGHKIASALLERCDVLVENFRPGTMDRLGLDYETAVSRNPGIVYCSLSGFGGDGPRANEPAYDVLMQGYAGLMGLTGYPDMPPVRSGMPISDLTAALYAAFGVVTALLQRERDGRGQLVETSLLEGQISWLSYYLVGYFANGSIPTRMGSSHHSLTPYQAYQASDESFVVAVGNDRLWERLCTAIEAPEWAADARFATNVERLHNREELEALLQSRFAQRPAAEWLDVLGQAGVPSGPINTVDRIAKDPQVWHRQMIEQIPHRRIPDLKLAGIPVKFSRSPGGIQSAPPLLGEHTDDILASLGYGQSEIADLHTIGAVE